MPSYYAKGSDAQDRQLKVQKLVIPFTVTASATSANVVLANDEPSIFFMKSSGVDQITAEVTALGDTATYTNSPNDATGVMNFFLPIGESVAKIAYAAVFDRAAGTEQPCFIGSATGISTLGNIMLTMDATTNFTTTSANFCLVVEYVASDS